MLTESNQQNAKCRGLGLASKSVLFLCEAPNQMTQKVSVELGSMFCRSRVMVGIDVQEILRFAPDVILCPYLLQKIPHEVFATIPCLILHPAPPEVGGPSALSRAILEGKKNWALCVIEANEEWDRGHVRALRNFELPFSSLVEVYRTKVTPMASDLFLQGLDNLFCGRSFERNGFNYQSRIKKEELVVDWHQKTEEILRKIYAGDNQPGAEGILRNKRFALFKASKGGLKGPPAEILKIDERGVLVGTQDASVLIERLQIEGGLKIPAYQLLKDD